MKSHRAVVLALLFSVGLNLILVSSIVYAYQVTCPRIHVDPSGQLVLEPGFTIPGRSIDTSGSGLTYHFTRYGTAKTSDWRPQSK
jgi:hypothetical protein